MTYNEFLSGVLKYWELFDKGLKKQANKFLFEFSESFKETVSEENADEVLCRFCREYLDEKKFPVRRDLPFQLTGLIYDYINRECEREKMPQMRWAFQLFGKHYNPHDPKNENNPYNILEKAYSHPDCDQRTVDLYFNEQVDWLYWGAHHFPEGCIISKESCENTIKTAETILSENTVDPALVEEFEYYKKLYEIYYGWDENGRNGDFYALCESAGLEFTPVRAFYYTK